MLQANLQKHNNKKQFKNQMNRFAETDDLISIQSSSWSIVNEAVGCEQVA